MRGIDHFVNDYSPGVEHDLISIKAIRIHKTRFWLTTSKKTKFLLQHILLELFGATPKRATEDLRKVAAMVVKWDMFNEKKFESVLISEIVQNKYKNNNPAVGLLIRSWSHAQRRPQILATTADNRLVVPSVGWSAFRPNNLTTKEDDSGDDEEKGLHTISHQLQKNNYGNNSTPSRPHTITFTKWPSFLKRNNRNQTMRL